MSPLQFLRTVQLGEAEPTMADIEQLMELAFVGDVPATQEDAELREWVRQALRVAYGHGYQQGEAAVLRAACDECVAEWRRR